MPPTYSSGVPVRGREVSLISLERCSRLATVASSEENDGSSMIGRFRLASKRTAGRNCRRITGICCWHCCQHSARPHHLPSLYSRFCLFCAIARSPLNPAALAFVPFGIVLVRVRVRSAPSAKRRADFNAPNHKSSTDLREAIKKILSQRDEVLHFRDGFTNEANLKNLMGSLFLRRFHEANSPRN